MVFHSSSASFSSSLSRSRFSCAASSSSSPSSSASSSSSDSPTASSLPSPFPFVECSRRSVFLAADAYQSDRSAPSSLVPFLWEEKPGVLKRAAPEAPPPSDRCRLSNGAAARTTADAYCRSRNGWDGHGTETDVLHAENCGNDRNADACGCASYYGGNINAVDRRELGFLSVSATSHGKAYGHSQRRASAVFHEQPRLRLPPRLLAPDHDASFSASNEQSAAISTGSFHRRNASGSSFSAQNGRRKHRLQGNSRGLSMDDDPFLLAFMVCKNDGESSSEASSTGSNPNSKPMLLEDQNLHFDQCIPRLNKGKLSMKALTSKSGKGKKIPSSSIGGKARTLEGSSKRSETPFMSASSSSSISGGADARCAYQHVVKSSKTKSRLFPDLLGCRSDNARLLPLQPAPLH